MTTPGGTGANQAAAAGGIAGRVAFIGCVGDDGSDRHRDHPAHPDGENSTVVSPGANTHVRAQMLDELEDVSADARVLVVQLETPLDTVAHVVSRARTHGSRVLVNAAPAVALTRGLLGLGPRSVVVALGPTGSVLLERGAAGLPLDVVTIPARRAPYGMRPAG